MEILPAVDVRGGRAVRLYQGDYAKETVYDDSPLSAAKRFEDEGATFLHAVDLDGARDGARANFDRIREIIRGTRLRVEVGGGIRAEDDVKAYLDLGARRVILGTAALEDVSFPARMAQKYGDQIAVGVDAKNGRVATRGWKSVSDADAEEFLLKMRDIGVRAAIFTDIARDGAMKGANIALYERLVKISGLSVVASGGVSTLDDIRALRKLGASGAILGKALYEGALSLKDALAAGEGNEC